MSTGSKALKLRQAGSHSTSARPESPLSLAVVEFMIPPGIFSQGVSERLKVPWIPFYLTLPLFMAIPA